ncbi:MAG: response regulator [Gammaproteobacteria bacterium]|nr:response regulator [Gammaproteobacteria bacterium]
MPTVVVVDNSPAIKTLFERSTEKLGIELIIFASAKDSLEYLQANKPDLLILSIILPDKNGITLLKELRKSPLHQDTSVIMVSSKDYAQDRLAASELGVLDFIPKPMPMQTITDVIVKYTKAEPISK